MSSANKKNEEIGSPQAVLVKSVTNSWTSRGIRGEAFLHWVLEFHSHLVKTAPLAG